MTRRRYGTINRDGHAVGLDLGATAVRAAILAPGRLAGVPSVSLQGMGSVELPPGAIVNGLVSDPSAVSEAIRRLWRTNRFGDRQVVLGIANPQILVRDMQMPNLEPAQRAKALPFRAREVIALPLDQVILDFAPLGDPHPDTGLVDGLLVATPHEPVLAAVRAVERAGLRVARVDLSAFGTLRAVADEHPAVEAVIDLGAHLTTIVIHHHGVPKLVRTFAQGGEELTRRLAERLSLSTRDAEQLKIEQGLTGRDDAASSALAEGVRSLIAEIRSSINYFAGGEDSTRLEQVCLTGGGSEMVGLADLLGSQLGVPTCRRDPMGRVARGSRRRHSTREPAPSTTAVSVGLAMGAAA